VKPVKGGKPVKGVKGGKPVKGVKGGKPGKGGKPDNAGKGGKGSTFVREEGMEGVRKGAQISQLLSQYAGQVMVLPMGK
jgi:hypothetical protein